MQRSLLAITLAVLFTLSSVVVDAQQPEAWVPEEPTFRDFVKAMVLSVPTITWRLARYFTYALCMPLSPCLSHWLRIVTQETSFGILLHIASFFFAPILSALSLVFWIPSLICMLPCLAPFSVYRETFLYFAPLAFPDEIGNCITFCGVFVPGLCIALSEIPIIIFVSMPIALIALFPAMLFEIIWIPFAPILLLPAIILRTQYQGIGLFIESLEKRAENFVTDLTESLIIRIFPSLEVLL